VLTEFAPAKVNLHLHLLGRRADGYHLLDSLVVFARAGDTVHARDAEDLSLSISGPFSGDLSAEPDNLVLRAARALAREAGITPRAALTLEKRLPVASGIGGGSADAAAALRALAELWHLTVDRHVLQQVAAQLGADVPVCLQTRPWRMGGIGDELAVAPALPPCGIALVNPGVALSTAEVFRSRQAAFSAPARMPAAWADAEAMAHDLSECANDLQSTAIRLCPEVSTVLAALAGQPGCLLARMSGSGATCFGLFPAAEAARQAAAACHRPGWWSWGGEMIRS
jgi:4-diphosphocytidyl-2-C-methyl-D-erythritol kinase